MKREQTKKDILYICNQCGKEFSSGNISIEEINELGLILYEKNMGDSPRNHLSRHYTGRTELDFCSYECSTKYLHEKCDVFVREVMKRKLPPNHKLF